MSCGIAVSSGVTWFLPTGSPDERVVFLPWDTRLLVRLSGARAKSFAKIRYSHLGAPFPKPEIVSSIETTASLSPGEL